MNYEITPAVLEDLPQLETLVNQAYRGDEARSGWTHEADLIEGGLRIDSNSLKDVLKDKDSVILKWFTGHTIYGCVH